MKTLFMIAFSLFASLGMLIVASVVWKLLRSGPLKSTEDEFKEAIALLVGELSKKLPREQLRVEWTETGNPRIVIEMPKELVLSNGKHVAKLPYLDQKKVILGYSKEHKLWSVTHGASLVQQSADLPSCVDKVVLICEKAYNQTLKLLNTVNSALSKQHGKPNQFQKVRPTTFK